MKQKDFDQWVKDVKTNEPKLTETEFDKLIKTSFVGRESFSSTHLSFRPAPEMDMSKHGEGKAENNKSHDMNDMSNMGRNGHVSLDA